MEEQWDCMSPVIQLEEMEKKAPKQKIVFFSISFQRDVQKLIE